MDEDLDVALRFSSREHDSQGFDTCVASNPSLCRRTQVILDALGFEFVDRRSSAGFPSIPSTGAAGAPLFSPCYQRAETQGKPNFIRTDGDMQKYAPRPNVFAERCLCQMLKWIK